MGEKSELESRNLPWSVEISLLNLYIRLPVNKSGFLAVCISLVKFLMGDNRVSLSLTYDSLGALQAS